MKGLKKNQCKGLKINEKFKCFVRKYQQKYIKRADNLIL